MRNKSLIKKLPWKPNEHNFFIEDVQPVKILKILQILYSKNTSGINVIPPKLKKIESEHIKNYLIDIFNWSIGEGVLQDKLKTALVYFIHKGDSNLTWHVQTIDQYLHWHFLVRFLKKIIHQRLKNVWNKQCMFYKNQYGFQKEKSAEHAKLDLYPNIVKPSKTKKYKLHVFVLC